MTINSQFTLKAAEKATLVRAEFSDAEWKRLHAYLKCSDDIAEAPILKTGFSVKSVITLGSKSSGADVSLPPMSDIQLLLHLLRPLILQNEQVSFVRMRSLLHQRIDNAIVRGMLDSQLRRFDGRRARSLVQIQFGGITLNSEEILLKWLNAYEFHRDEDKQSEIDALDAAFPAQASRAAWIGLLMHKCQAIFDLAGIVACVTGRTGELLSEGPNPF